MNTLTKILLAALGAVVLIFMAIAVAVAFVFEPNDYRPFLMESVQNATGRNFRLDGDLELELFPCCGVAVGSAVLGNPPGFPDEPFARIESASVSVKIWPLLTRREVQIGTVTLVGAQVNLIELADGRTNWEFDNPETTAEPADSGETTIASLTIDGLAVRNGGVTYTGGDGQRYTARDIVVDAGAIGSDSPVPVSVKLVGRDEGADTAAEIDLTGSLTLAGSLVSLSEPRLTVRATGQAIPTGEADVALTAGTLRYDTDAGAGQVQGLQSSVSLPGTRLEMDGDVEMSTDGISGTGSFHIPEGNLRRLVDALPDLAYVPVSPEALKSLGGTGRWSLTAKGASLSELALNLDGSSITGSIDVTDFDSGALRTRLNIDQLALDGYLPESSTGSTPPAPSEPTEVPFESLAGLLLDADLNIGRLTAQGLTLDDLDARFRQDDRALSIAVSSGLFGGTLTLNGSGSVAGASPALAGTLELQGISPRAALTAFGEPPETVNPDALTRLSGATRWQLGRRSLDLEQMSWQLDGTRLTGSLGVTGFDAPATRFDLALDRMNLDDYLSPDTEPEADDGAADVEIPADVIRGLDLNGRLKAGALRVMGLDLTNVDTTVSAENGVLRLAPLTAALYGGTYQGTIVIDATGSSSRLTLDQRLTAVQVGQLLDTLVGSDRIAGALTLNLSGSGTGNTTTELLKALSGNLDFNLSDGVYHGMDVGYEIENAQSLLKRTAAPERPNRKETPIRALSFAGSIAEGVIGSDSLNAEIPYLKLGGKGGVNLLERTLDYQLNARVMKTADSASGTSLKGLAGSTIPLTITGPMASPKVGVNLQGLVVETVKEKARDALIKRLGLDQEAPTATGATTAAGTAEPAAGTSASQAVPAEQEPAQATEAAEPPAAEPPTTRDLLEQGLRGLLKRPAAESSKEP